MYYINIVPKLTNFNMKLTKNHGIETEIYKTIYYSKIFKVEVKSVLRIGSAHNNVRTLQCEHCPNFECFEFF
jgi:hypothetical protein